MIAIGVLHIVLLLIAYVLYLLVAVKSFSGKVPYKILATSNMLYLTGFVLGMVWAKIEWGFYLNPDIKTIISILIFFPFLLESILKRNEWKLPVIGAALIILNYILPLLVYTIHIH